MSELNQHDRISFRRYFDLSRFIAPCVAAMLGFASLGAAANTDLSDFLDPFEDIRGQMEAPDKGATEAPTMGADKASPVDTIRSKASEITDAANTTSKGLVERINVTLASVSSQYKLSRNGLLGILGLSLLTVALLIAWPLFRRPKARLSGDSAQDRERAIYAGNTASERPVLDSGAHAARHRKTTEFEATQENVDTSADSDARPISSAVAQAREYALPGGGDETAEDTADIDRENPDTWRRPNLDRLKTSIREDWHSEQAEAEEQKSAFEDDDAQAFAELFGDDEPPTAPTVANPADRLFGRAAPAAAAPVAPTPEPAPVAAPEQVAAPEPVATAPAEKATGSTVLDMLDSYDGHSDTPSSTEKQADVRESAPIFGRSASKVNTDDGAGESRPTSSLRSDAIQRVRALKESVLPT